MGAKNSESCLIEIQSLGEESEVIYFKVKASTFRFLTPKFNVSTIKFMS